MKSKKEEAVLLGYKVLYNRAGKLITERTSTDIKKLKPYFTNEDYATLMRKFGSLGYAIMKSKDGRVRILDKDVFQDPNYKRHDAFGYNYRMPEVAAAMGLAQLSKMPLITSAE